MTIYSSNASGTDWDTLPLGDKTQVSDTNGYLVIAAASEADTGHTHGLSADATTNGIDPSEVAGWCALIGDTTTAYTDCETVLSFQTVANSSGSSAWASPVLRGSAGKNGYIALVNYSSAGSTITVQIAYQGMGGDFTYALAQTAAPVTISESSPLVNMRMRVVGSSIMVRLWDATVAEPSGWTQTATDTSLASGNMGATLWSNGTENLPVVTDYCANPLTSGSTLTPLTPAAGQIPTTISGVYEGSAPTGLEYCVDDPTNGTWAALSGLTASSGTFSCDYPTAVTGRHLLFVRDAGGTGRTGVTSGVTLLTANSTGYTLTGPDSVATGKTATFSVEPTGGTQGPSADTVVTFSDGGAGGSFNPATVTLAKGSTTAESSVYTAPSAPATVSISTTNSGGLTNPSAISLSVVSSIVPATTYSVGLSAATVSGGGTVTLSVAANNNGPSASTVVTFSDGGAGGSFNPATVTIPLGSSAVQQSVYTAPVVTADTSVSLTSTNSTSLADPAAQTLAVTPATLTMGATIVTLDPTTGIPSVTTNPQGGSKPSFIVYRGSQDYNNMEEIAKVSALPYVDTDAPCGDLIYQITATDSSVTGTLDGGKTNCVVATTGDTSALTIDTASNFFMDKPNGLLRFDVTGALPANVDSAKTKAVIQFKYEGQTLCTYNWAPKVSGQASADRAKKGYSGTVTNASGSKVTMKFGQWTGQTKIPVKGYGYDRSMCRDVVGNRWWKMMAQDNSWPECLIVPESAYSTITGSFPQPGAAPLMTDAFPVKAYFNGAHQGLLCLRTGGANEDWLIDDSNPQHIFMQFDHAGAAGMGTCNWFGGWDYVQWDIAAPAMTGYSDQGEIPAAYATVQANIERPFTFLANCSSGADDFKTNASQYFDITSWINYFIFTEVAGNPDGIANNIYMATYDTQIWYAFVYDLDLTFGFFPAHSGDYQDPIAAGLMTQRTDLGTNANGVWLLLWENFATEIKARWKHLRDSGTISVDTVAGLLNEFSAQFGPDEYESEIEIWGADTYASANYILFTWLAPRIAYLDTVFGYAGPGVQGIF